MIRHVLKMVWNRKRGNALIVAEIFLSFLVLFAVLTLASALAGSVGKPLGFEWQNVWNVSLEHQLSGDSGKTQRETTEMVMRELQAMPQVLAVGGSAMPAYAMSSMEGTWNVQSKQVFLTQDQVTDGFAEVMRLNVLRGRWFGPEDDAAHYEPVVVDADLARAVYGGEDPIGKPFQDSKGKPSRIVGVVASYRKSGEFANFGKPVNMLFERATAEKKLPGNILIRLRPGTPGSFEQTLSDRLHEIAPGTTFRIRQMSRMREFARRAALLPLAALGVVAAFLISMVILGLSGVLWQNVTRRMREIGLRRAVGASGASVRRQVAAEVAMLTTFAVIPGLAIVTQLPLLGLLTVITPSAFLGGIAASLAAIYALTVLCGVYPGWLASRVQPARALHYE